MARFRWLVLLLLTLVVGCSADGDDVLNDLWRQGYGFNNPNAARAREGREPVDF